MTPGSLPTRRALIGWGLAGAGLALVPDAVKRRVGAIGVVDDSGLGPADANGWRLAPGFVSRRIATTGQPVADTSYVWHANPDGGATVPTSSGGWIYLSNSESPPLQGGVSAIEFAPDGSIVAARSILSGTTANCSGSATPWHTYLSCEEHPLGRVFECDPRGIDPAVARPAMGVFPHEGAAVDVDRQVIYLTEDLADGALYRFRPDVWGDLSSGVLSVLTESAGGLAWTAVSNPTPGLGDQPTRFQVPGTRRFAGGEGIAWWNGRVVFTTKLDNRVWTLDPATMALSVLYDDDTNPNPQYTGVDQITVAPWGDLVGVEDGGDLQVIVLAPDGTVRVLAQLTGVGGSELTGVAFDPSGSRLYVTSQRNPGATFEITGPFPASGPAVADVTSRFVPLPPERLLDTRSGFGAPRAAALGPDQALALQVTGRAGVPATATAVVLNVTATESRGAGYVTAWPHGRARPLASNLNVERPGQTVANLVTVPLGAGGLVGLYTQSGAHLVADVAGYYESAATARAGRYRPVVPGRILDTRDGTGVDQPGSVPDDGTILVAVTDRAGVPAAGVAAVVLNVTATGSTGAGYVTVWPAGQPRPLASNLNLERAGQTVPNQVIVPVGADGRVAMYAQTATHLVADVSGWITDDSRPENASGLFVPLVPSRLLDTRIGNGAPAAPVPAGGTVVLALGGRGQVPGSGVSAVALNVTATGPSPAPGYVTVWPSDRPRPLASNLNVDRPDQTVPNHVTVPLSPGGQVSLYTQSGTHLVADVAGYFT